MTHASLPASRRQSTRTGKVKQAEIRQKNTPRSRRRSVPRMLLPRITVLVMALALLVGVMVWVHGTGTSASTTDQEQQAPTFTLPTLAGATFDLAAKRGHPIVLYFMGPCASSLQGSQQIAQALQSGDLLGAEALVIDANAGDRPTDLSAFVKQTGIATTTPINFGIDTTGALLSAYQVQTLETTVVIDRQGHVAARHAGSLSSPVLVQMVRDLP